MRRTSTILGFLVLVLFGGALSAQQRPSAGSSDSSSGGPGGTGSDAHAAGPSTSQSAAEPEFTLPDYFYKHLTGTIAGKYQIVMNLTRLGSALLGDYYYANQGIPLFFGYGSTISTDGSIHLIETNQLEPGGASDVTGTFDGRFVGKDELRGTWSKSGSESSLPFAVSTVGLSGGSFDIEHNERSYYDHSYASAKIDITYPVMHTTSAESDAAFNANVLSTVLSLYENGITSVPPSSISQALEDFIGAFKAQFADSGSRSYFPPWSYSITARVLFDTDNIVSLRYEAFSFEGGAHPNTVYRNASYLRTTGSIIGLADLLRAGYENRLNEIGLEEFRKQHGIKEGETLQQAGYSVSDRDFKLNTNFFIAKAGLVFQFNQYEIAPYYFGAQQVLIPYSKLGKLIRQGGPIAGLAAQAGAAPIRGGS